MLTEAMSELISRGRLVPWVSSSAALWELVFTAGCHIYHSQSFVSFLDKPLVISLLLLLYMPCASCAELSFATTFQYISQDARIAVAKAQALEMQQHLKFLWALEESSERVSVPRQESMHASRPEDKGEILAAIPERILFHEKLPSLIRNKLISAATSLGTHDHTVIIENQKN